MKPKLLSRIFMIGAIAVINHSLFAQDCKLDKPPGSHNMCNPPPGAGTIISNTSNTITLTNAGSIPPDGPCTLTINYYDESLPLPACSGAYTCSGTISTSGTTVTITLGGCAIPDFSSTAIFYINIQTAGGIYFYHVKNHSCDYVLPIHISTWDAQRIQTSSQYAIKVSWTADIENNASHVIIERNSVAGQYEFSFEIGRVDVDHSSSPPHSYQFIDYYPLNGANWYRLKLVDLDGSYEYVDPKSASCPGCQYAAPWVDCSSHSIVGPSWMCSGTAVFTESNHLFYNKTTWSTDNGLVSYNPSTGPATALTQWGRGVTLLAMSQSRCSPGTRTKYKPIEVGPPPVTGQFAPSSNTGGYEELIRDGMGTNYAVPGHVWVWPSFNGTNPTWTMLWGNVTTWDASGSNLHFVMPQGGDVTFQIDFNTAHCGMASEMFTFMDGGWGFASYYSLSPNPATSQLTLSVDDRKLDKMQLKRSGEQDIKQVIILDKLGNIVMQQKYGPNTRNTSLNIALLRHDIYTVRIFNGKKWTTMKFIKQ